MNTFVIGATGLVGAALAQHLADGGHTVTGLARTEAAAAALEAQGIDPVVANLETGRPAVIEAARRADAVIYAAQPEPAQETAAIEDLTRAMAGTGRTLLFLSGSGVLLQRTEGAWSQDTFAEHDPFTVEPPAAFRRAAEDTVLGAAADGVRAMVIRPGLIWGPGDHGHVPMIYQSVARTGAACYVGPGLNTYSNVHIADVSSLFNLALEHGQPGGLYHAVAGEVPTAGSRSRSPPISASRPAASHRPEQPTYGASSGRSSWVPPAGSGRSAHHANSAGDPNTPTCSP